MLYRLLADIVVAVHLLFVGFVILGGLLALRWPRAMWAHLPAAAWGALIEFAGWICPLTPLENWLRMRGGEQGMMRPYSVFRWPSKISWPRKVWRPPAEVRF